MSAMRILAVPIAGRQVASSRIRLYSLVEALPERFDTTVAVPQLGAELRDCDPMQFDLVYVQKDARPPVIDLSRRAAEAGIPVVYDIDDDFGCWPGMAEASMCEVANVVTVDSESRAVLIREVTSSTVVTLPCMIDLAESPERVSARPIRQKIRTVASFGNLVSLRHTLPYIEALPSEITTYLIGPGDAGLELPGATLVPFELGTFVAHLTAADVFILAHGPREASLKDNNRLIMAMSLARPALASPSPAYLEVLGDLGLERLACQANEVAARLEELADPTTRAQIGAAGYEYAWSRYSPERCVERFTKVLDIAVGGDR